MKSIKISACIICKNEAKLLEKSLESIKDVVDEIVFVDTGSTDNSIEIAKKYTNRIYHFEWIDDFSAARNFTQSKAKYDYILLWDGDWVLDEKSAKKIEELKRGGFTNLQALSFTWINFFDTNFQIRNRSPKIFIYDKNYYDWKYMIFEKLVQKKLGQRLNTRHFADIEVLHLKDQNPENYRFQQDFELIQKSLEQYPQDTHVLEGVILEFYRNEKYSEVLEYFLQLEELEIKAKTLHPESFYSVLICTIDAFIKLSETKDALDLLLKYEAEYPDHLDLWVLKGDILTSSDILGAKEQYEKVIQVLENNNEVKSYRNYDRVNIHPYQVLAEIEAINNQPEIAINYLKKSLLNCYLQDQRNEIQLRLKEISQS